MTDYEKALKIIRELKNLADHDAVFAFMELVKVAKADEREACALLVEDADVETRGGFYDQDDARATLKAAAKAIRERSKS